MTGRGYEVINRLRSFKFIAADKLVAERLQVAEGETVAQIKRARLINREPIAPQITYLPKAIGERLEKADLVTRDIFLILENDCGLALGHADLAIDAVLADSDLTQALNVEPGSPIMRIERLTHDLSASPWTSNTFTTVAMPSSTACALTGKKGRRHDPQFYHSKHSGAGIRHRRDRRRHRRTNGGDQGQGTQPRPARVADRQGQSNAAARSAWAWTV